MTKADQLMDDLLNIKTTGLRHWRNEEANLYNRAESTPYKALDYLFKHYDFEEDDLLLDFGAGRGRILFYTHYRQDIPVRGIELHDLTFDELADNQESYLRISKNEAEIELVYGYADDYELSEDETVCFFFNPFRLSVFKDCMKNIVASLTKYPRQVDVILYYPETSFLRYLEQETPFELVQAIHLPEAAVDKRQKFKIFRYLPPAEEDGEEASD